MVRSLDLASNGVSVELVSEPWWCYDLPSMQDHQLRFARGRTGSAVLLMLRVLLPSSDSDDSLPAAACAASRLEAPLMETIPREKSPFWASKKLIRVSQWVDKRTSDC